MSAAAASAIILPPITEAWYAKPFRFAILPKAAEKVWACIKFESYRRRSNTITITDRFGAQWCTAHIGVHVGRRCFQKGLKQLENIGAIIRHRSRGGREITITVQLAAPKPKAKAKASARKTKPAPAATAAPAPSRAGQAARQPRGVPPGRRGAQGLHRPDPRPGAGAGRRDGPPARGAAAIAGDPATQASPGRPRGHPSRDRGEGAAPPRRRAGAPPRRPRRPTHRRTGAPAQGPGRRAGRPGHASRPVRAVTPHPVPGRSEA